MKDKKNLIINVAFAVIVIILLNLIFYFGFFRVDLTSNKIYSLSKASKKLVSKFDDYIIIRAVFSKLLPEQFKFIKLYVEDILKEYRIASRGKIKFEFIDPQQPRSKFNEQEIQSMGIVPVEFTVLEKDKFEVKKGYMGLAMLYKDKKEVIPVVNNIETLEYDITSALKRLTMKEKKVLGVLSSHRSNTLSGDNYFRFRQHIEKTYSLKEVEISSDSLKDIEGLVIISPKENFDNKELFYLDQYILSGKPVAFLLSRYNINLQTFWAYKIYSNIFDLLAHYGIEFTEGLIADYKCQRVQLTSRHGFFIMTNLIDYPYMPIVTDLNKTHPLVKDISQVVLPFVASISVKSDLKDVSYTILMKTSKHSFIKKDVFSINPLTVDFKMPKDAQKGPFIVGVELRGKLKSFYEKEEKFKELKLNLSSYLKETTQNKESRILVISTGEFVEQELGLLSNIFDYLAQEQDLLSIRGKDVTPSPLRVVSPTFKIVYRYFVMIVPTVLVIGFGMLRWYYRKNRLIQL
ncbi:MAG: GldG family protein [Endomicrobiia bacterium]